MTWTSRGQGPRRHPRRRTYDSSSRRERARASAPECRRGGQGAPRGTGLRSDHHCRGGGPGRGVRGQHLQGLRHQGRSRQGGLRHGHRRRRRGRAGGRASRDPAGHRRHLGRGEAAAVRRVGGAPIRTIGPGAARAARRSLHGRTDRSVVAGGAGGTAQRRHDVRAAPGRHRCQLRTGIGVDEVRDVVWTCISVEVYDLLVLQRGWSLDDYARWLARILAASVCP